MSAVLRQNNQKLGESCPEQVQRNDSIHQHTSRMNKIMQYITLAGMTLEGVDTGNHRQNLELPPPPLNFLGMGGGEGTFTIENTELDTLQNTKSTDD